MKIIKEVLQSIVLGILFGLIYVLLEILWRGYSHWTMFILGGICFLFAGIQNEYIEWEYPLWRQVLNVDVFVIISEFITGCIVNLYFHWNVWDYSNLPFNILGQSCPQFALLFMPICLFAIVLDDYVRYFIFHEDKPHYKLR